MKRGGPSCKLWPWAGLARCLRLSFSSWPIPAPTGSLPKWVVNKSSQFLAPKVSGFVLWGTGGGGGRNGTDGQVAVGRGSVSSG